MPKIITLDHEGGRRPQIYRLTAKTAMASVAYNIFKFANDENRTFSSGLVRKTSPMGNAILHLLAGGRSFPRQLLCIHIRPSGPFFLLSGPSPQRRFTSARMASAPRRKFYTFFKSVYMPYV